MNKYILKLSLAMAVLIGITWNNALAQTKTLTYIKSISGSKTVAGQEGKQYWETMKSVSGKYPGMWGEDFSFSPFGGTTTMAAWRSSLVTEAKLRWSQGAIINFMFHACPPTLGEPCGWGDVTGKLTDAQWTQLITNGSSLNNAWKARLDVIATYLQDLKNNGVEVLFRPFHEMNHPTVFWWANRPGTNGSSKLYQITHDYLLNTKGLTNIVWVWNLQDFGTLSSDINNYDPGSSYYDMITLDNYNSDGQGFSSAKYNTLVSKAGSKPIGIGECGTLPTSSLLSSQPRWTYFLGWAELTQQDNSNAVISSLYNAGNVLTLDELPGWSSTGGSSNIAYHRPVTVSSTENATNIGSNAVDANGTTRWSSLYTDPQWIYVDLGATYNVNRVKISWEAAYGKNYYLEGSTNASTWTNIKTITNNTALVNDYTGLSANARYIRMYGTARGTAYGYSIFEFEVYGTATGGRLISGDEIQNTELTDETSAIAYPNPAENNVTVKLSSSWLGGKIALINTSGATLSKDEITTTEHSFDLTNRPTGLYVISISNSNRRQAIKVFKK